MNERDFENVLAKYPELIEIGLSLEGRQVIIKSKRIDLLYRDQHGSLLIVELKRGTVLRKDIGQVMDYEGELLSPDDPTVRVMLIGNRVPPNFRRALEHHGLEWKEFSIAFLIEFLKQKNDNEFLQYFTEEEIRQTTIPKPIEKEESHQNKALSNSSNKIWDKVRKVFDSSRFDMKLTRKQIIDMIVNEYKDEKINRRSVIPSDYCYNKVNAGIPFKYHCFEYLRDVVSGKPQYRVLGEYFDYEGNIYWKDEIVGKWIKGETKPCKDARWPPGNPSRNKEKRHAAQKTNN